MNKSIIDFKKQQVIEITEKINNSAATVIVEYAGLSVEDMKELRTELRKDGVELKVLKNNITSRAYKEANLGDLAAEISGPTAVAFSEQDVTAAAKTLNEFSKTHTSLKLKAGSLNGEVASLEQVKELATLPNKEGMISMLLSVLEAPIRGLAQVTQQVADQKED